MHTLKIKIKDSAYEKIQYFLKNLPADDIEVVSDELESENPEMSIDCSQFNIKSYKDIVDPVLWQKTLRDEWDR